jgi:hypothetical protein
MRSKKCETSVIEPYPCPDVLFSESLQVEATPQPVASRDSGLLWPSLALAAGIVIFLLLDLWLVKRHQHTMSDIPRKGPKWTKFLVGGALTALLWHLLVQGS